MCKSCKNCYWKYSGDSKWCYYHEKNNEEKCDRFTPKCSECNMDIANYEYNGKLLCFECLAIELNKIGVIVKGM